MLKHNPREKTLKDPFIVYTELECLLGKTDTCQNDPKKSFTEKKAEHTPSGYSWVTCCSFDKLKTNGVITEEKPAWKCFVKI